MKKVIVKDFERCTGCRTCEAVCSTVHEGRCNPSESRIRIITYPEIGLNVPMGCSHCDMPLCMQVCPIDAITRDDDSGAVVIKPDLCVGCLMCISACPIGAISINPTRNKVIKCDLCGGEPTCVEFCSVNALQYITLDEVDLAKKRKSFDKYIGLLESRK